MLMAPAFHTGRRANSLTAYQQNEGVDNNISFKLGAGVKRT